MLALWSCGRRASVVQAQRQIHRAFRAAFTVAETVVRTIAEQAAPSGRNTRIGDHGSEDHSVRGFSAPLLQATLQCSQLPLRVDAGVLSLQPLQKLARGMPRLCLKPSSQLGRDCRKWIGSTAQSLRFRLCYASRPDLTLLPRRAQPREELLQCREAWFRRITEDGTVCYCDEFLLDRTDLL